MNKRDVIAGILMIGFGAFVAWYSLRYDLGTLRRMGPGMFPTIMAYALMIMGVLILVPALYKRGGEVVAFEVRSFVFVIGAIGVFALTMPRFGIVPAIVSLTVVASIADGRMSPLVVLVLAVALSLIAVMVFHYLLGTALVPFKWDP